MAEKITFTNSSGVSIELSNRKPFLLESVNGKGDVSANIQMQTAPFQDGSSYLDSLLQTRTLTLMVSITADDRNDLLKKRQLLASVFNPKLGLGVLKYENGYTSRSIKVVAETVPVFPTGLENNGRWYQKTMINLLAPSPFWEDVEETKDTMNVFIGKFEFPISIEGQGMEFGIQGERAVINNIGDVPTPVTIEFYGPATNPKVTNLTTGEYILVNRSLEANEKLVLTTDFGNKNVEIVKEGVSTNAFGWIDLNSVFWSLQVGENEVEYEADIGASSATVNINYKNRYLSV